MPAKKPKPDEKPQIERFIETAREIGADETQKGFEKAFDLVTSTKKPSKPKRRLIR
jgi:hypothetical protein